MTKIQLITKISAPIGVCFDLSRDISFHQESMAHTDEKAISGKTNGLIELNEEVTWLGKHFGLYHKHTAKITLFDKPNHFQDQMIKGRFKTFIHDHFFTDKGDHTLMTENLEFSAPLWPLNILIERIILKPYLTKLLKNRNKLLKVEAERRYLENNEL